MFILIRIEGLTPARDDTDCAIAAIRWRFELGRGQACGLDR